MCVLAGCASNTTAAPPTTPPSQRQYGSYTQSYTVPWLDEPNFSDLTKTLKVQVSVGGGTPYPYIVDTGSVGMVLPASDVPNLPPNSPPGSMLYNSSGLELTGVWATLPMSFPQAVNAKGDTVIATAKVPVLAVDTARCIGKGVNSGQCDANHIPRMLGMGFGRGTTVQTSPEYNPLLNLTEMVAGTMRRGYIIGRGGLSLGLTDTNVTGTWAMQQLTSAGPPASGSHNDWTTPTGGFQLGSDAKLSGTALLDTGLLDMIIEDTSQHSHEHVAAGTPLTITLGNSSYTFRVGDGGTQTPTIVNHTPATHGTFVNTGLRALGDYDLLFDADGGYLGLRVKKAVPVRAG
jgi:hypothetical protein